jgi:dihydroorotate dehydrogenase (NAD+) catalytic subunit
MGQDLSIEIGKLKLNNPVIVSSGCCEITDDIIEISGINELGAYISKTVTFNERKGNPQPRTTEVSCGILNSIGIQNEGLYGFLNNKLPKLIQKLRIPIIVSIGGSTIEEFAKLASHLTREKKIQAIEVNISCPNLDKRYETHGMFSQDEHLSYGVIKAVRETTDLPLVAKLSPMVTNIVSIAQAVWDAGCDAITVANTYPAMAIDIEKRKSKLGAITGGLSGPAIKPITLKHVWDVSPIIRIPIIASGGIMSWQDALEYIIAGAMGVAIGTAVFVKPDIGIEIINGIRSYLEKHNVSYKQLIGSLKI